MKKCDTCDYHWFAATNEEGWRCVFCDHKPGEPPGYDPKLDREEIYRKVYGILDTLHNADLFYVSNGSAGDAICNMVSEACRQSGLYDQQSIIAAILNAGGDGHTKYWRHVGEGILAGKDPRRRCPCGALSDSATFKDGESIYRCSEHWQIKRDADVPARVPDLASRRNRR